MAVFRIDKTRDYTVMANHHLRNKALSLKAKGLLSLMLSLPEDWDYTTKGLSMICKDGVDSNTTATATAGDADLTASVSVTGQGGDALGSLTYQWEYHVISATPLGKTAITNPNADWRSLRSNDSATATASTYSIPTSNSPNVYLYVPYDKNGTTDMKMKLVSGDSLWAEYESVTVEIRCEVKNTENEEYVTGYSSPVTVTLNAPTFDLTVSGTDSEGNTTPPLRVKEGRSVTLYVTEQAGCTYQWYRSSSDSGSLTTLPNNVTTNAASLEITTGYHLASLPYYACKITHTASGITWETARVYVGMESADGTALTPDASSEE